MINEKTAVRFGNTLGKCIVISILFAALSFVYKPRIPHHDAMSPEIFQDPVQTETTREIFEYKGDENRIFVKPLYEYELWGVVVSYNNYYSLIDIDNTGTQERAKDLCIIWGDNVTNDLADEVYFSSTNFTCSYRYNAETLSQPFRDNQISNNHLISDNKDIHALINRVDIGDQVHVKGVLADYGIYHTDGEKYWVRQSSTTRDDTGGNACETIYVDSFEIVRKSSPLLAPFLDANRFIAPILILIWVIFIFSEHFWMGRSRTQEDEENIKDEFFADMHGVPSTKKLLIQKESHETIIFDDDNPDAP